MARKGSITQIVLARGFGFLTAADGDDAERYFFHSSALSGATFESLHIGQVVTFEAEDSEKGPRASAVFVE